MLSHIWVKYDKKCRLTSSANISNFFYPTIDMYLTNVSLPEETMTKSSIIYDMNKTHTFKRFKWRLCHCGICSLGCTLAWRNLLSSFHLRPFQQIWNLVTQSIGIFDPQQTNIWPYWLGLRLINFWEHQESSISFYYNAIQDRNLLPDSIKSITDLQMIKKEVKVAWNVRVRNWKDVSFHINSNYFKMINYP